MNDDRYAHYGAVTGIVFVVLTVIGFLIVIPAPPDLNAPSDQWPQYFSENQGEIRAGLVLLTIGWFFFIRFLGTVSSTLRIAAQTLAYR